MDLKNITNKINSLTPRLVCPICHGGFEIQGRSLRCVSGHSFDFSKSGNLNFISQKVNQKPDAYYQAELALHDLPPFHALLQKILVNAGPSAAICLTGSSLSCLLPQGALGFEIDSRSVEAQLKADPDQALFTAHTARLPLADSAIDRMIRLDEQIDLTESLRVLKPGGRLIRILPARSHLLEVRQILFTGRRQGQREKPELLRAIHELANQGHPMLHQRFSVSLEPTENQWDIILGQWDQGRGPNRSFKNDLPAVTFAWEIYELQAKPQEGEEPALLTDI